MTRRPIFLIVIAFLLGGLCGGALMSWRMIHAARAELVGPPGETEARIKLFILSRALHMSAQQREALRAPIIDSTRAMQQLRQRLEPDALAIRKRERDTVRAALTDDQRKVLDTYLHEMDRATGLRQEP